MTFLPPIVVILPMNLMGSANSMDAVEVDGDDDEISSGHLEGDLQARPAREREPT